MIACFVYIRLEVPLLEIPFLKAPEAVRGSFCSQKEHYAFSDYNCGDKKSGCYPIS